MVGRVEPDSEVGSTVGTGHCLANHLSDPEDFPLSRVACMDITLGGSLIKEIISASKAIRQLLSALCYPGTATPGG